SGRQRPWAKPVYRPAVLEILLPLQTQNAAPGIRITISISTGRLQARALPGRWYGATAGPARAPECSPRLPRAIFASPRLPPYPATGENRTGRPAPPTSSARHRETTTAARP